MVIDQFRTLGRIQTTKQNKYNSEATDKATQRLMCLKKNSQTKEFSVRRGFYSSVLQFTFFDLQLLRKNFTYWTNLSNTTSGWIGIWATKAYKSIDVNEPMSFIVQE